MRDMRVGVPEREKERPRIIKNHNKGVYMQSRNAKLLLI